MAIATLLLLSLLVADQGQTSSPPANVDATAADIFSQVMSPYCPGLLLRDCPSSAAFDLRAEIRARLAAGETRAAIEASLYRRFGDGIRAVPPAEGWGVLPWLVPPVVLALTLAALAAALAHMRARAVRDSNAEANAPIDPAMENRLDEELEELG